MSKKNKKIRFDLEAENLLIKDVLRDVKSERTQYAETIEQLTDGIVEHHEKTIDRVNDILRYVREGDYREVERELKEYRDELEKKAQLFYAVTA